MRILAIGNSFSQDASRYLNQVALRSGLNIEVANLMIGGCSLETHYRNMLSGERAYSMEFNGQNTGFSVSLEDALLSRDWDVITVQQASRFSVDYDSYQPYLDRFADYMRKSEFATQFICVTHRRGTMEAADMLYGVTMQEKGITKLLELNVSELEKKFLEAK
jgi:hypothetical protein